MASVKKNPKSSTEPSEPQEKMEISSSNYNPGGSQDTLRSQFFQILILILFALKGKFLNDFKLSSEVKDAHPFDDLMIKFLNERNEKNIRLLQAKYKMNPENITWETLFKMKSLNLTAYFTGLNRITSSFNDNILDVIIATNLKLESTVDGVIKLKSETTNNFIVLENVKEVDLCFGAAGRRYKISKREEYLENNKEVLREQFKQKKNKTTNETISNFIDKFMIVTDLSQENLKEEISLILRQLFNDKDSVETNYALLEHKFREWFVNISNDNIFDIAKLEDIFQGISGDTYKEYLNVHMKYLYNQADNLEFKDESVFSECVESDYKTVFLETNVGDSCYAKYYWLKNLKRAYKNDEFMVLSTENLYNLQESVNHFCKTDSSRLINTNYCVIEVRDIDELKSPILEAISSARKFVETAQTNKKLIVLARGEVLKFFLMQSSRPSYKHLKLNEFKLSDLTEDSSAKWLNTQIIFQNYNMFLKDILCDSNHSLLLPSWNLKDVEHIKTIAGNVIQNENSIPRFYVPRTFCRENKKLTIIPNDGSNLINQDAMINLGETGRVVLISDVPGMGKSFMLNDMAIKIKQAYQNHWVILVNLNQFSEFFRKISVNEIDESFVIRFLGEKVLVLNNESQIKLLSDFCKNVGNVQILFDGMDEIAPEYTEHVLMIIRKLLEMKVNRIFISTRPEKFEKEIEKYTDQIKYSLNKFNDEDLRKWLKKFCDLHFDANSKEKGKFFELCQSVIKNINESIRDNDRNFTGIPLIIKLVCEILLDENTENPNEFKNIFELYESFVRKKIIIYLKEKNVFQSSSAGVGDIMRKSISSLEDDYMKFALEKFLTDNERSIISDNLTSASEDDLYDEKTLCKCGIITRFNSDCYFVHKTFGEYFICLYLKKYFNDANVAQFILKYILIEDRFNFVRMLLNCCLRSDERESIVQKRLVLYGNYIRENLDESQKGFRHAIQEQNDDLFQFLFDALINVDSKEDRKKVKEFMKNETSIVADYFRNIEDQSGLLQKINEKFQTKFVKDLIMQKYRNERFHENLLLVSTAKGSNAVTIIEWMKENTPNQNSFMRLVLKATDNFKRNLLHKIIYCCHEENKDEKMKLFFNVLTAIDDVRIHEKIYKNLLDSSDKDEYKLLHWMERKKIDIKHKIKFNNLLNEFKRKKIKLRSKGKGFQQIF